MQSAIGSLDILVRLGLTVIEEFENLWFFEAEAKCITTNGFVKKNGEAVMGAGVAKQAKMHFPKLPAAVGKVISTLGNHVAPVYMAADLTLFSFPVKHNWWEPADLELIERSAGELVEWINDISEVKQTRGADPIERVALPRPGCGNGQLEWIDVRPVIKPILDDRFVILEIKAA